MAWRFGRRAKKSSGSSPVRSLFLRFSSVTPEYEHATPFHVHTSVPSVQLVLKSPDLSVSPSLISLSASASPLFAVSVVVRASAETDLARNP